MMYKPTVNTDRFTNQAPTTNHTSINNPFEPFEPHAKQTRYEKTEPTRRQQGFAAEP